MPAQVSMLAPAARRPLLRRLAPAVLWTAAMVVLLAILPTYLQDLMSKVLILGVFAMSLDILLGYTGLFSFGHAAFLGVGSYTAGMLMIRYQVSDVWIGVVAGVVVSTLVGAAFGVIALRMRGAYFLLVTFALSQLLLSLASTWGYLSPAGFGSQGIIGITLPTVGPVGSTLSSEAFYYVTIGVLVVCYLALRGFLKTPTGLALQGVREREGRMRALGYNTWRVNYVAYVVGAAFAGLAGVLLAWHDGIANPDIFSVDESTLVMLMVLIGGAGTLYGPLIGATVIVVAEYYASTYLTERWPLILGGLFVVTIMFARGGLARMGADWTEAWRRRRRQADATETAEPEPVSRPPDSSAAPPAPAQAPASAAPPRPAPAPEPWTPPAGEAPALAVEGLCKHFGGVRAVDDISLAVRRGERLAIIGTNGAGKSTLFNLISGEQAPTAGTVSLFGHDITRLPVHRRAQLGIGRSFQINTLFAELTVLTSVWLAIQASQPWRWGAVRPASRHTETMRRAEEMLTAWGLAHVRDMPAREISYGEQRRLEIVLALASEPRLLLMDEPTAGQTLTESVALAEHLRGLPRDITAIVIAHDMDLVFSFADRIVVMHQGVVVAEGTSAEIEANPVVQQSYMGTPLTEVA